MTFIKKYKNYIIWIAVTLAAGGLGALLSGGFKFYTSMNKPPLAPPPWLFPIAWAILYILIGFAAGIIAESHDLDKNSALKLYSLQLIINAIWPIIFFRLKSPGFALFWLLILIVCVIATLRVFKSVSNKAFLLCIPYIAWLFFAFYLNFGIVVLN